MPRGYRCILVAFVGIALAGASPPNQTDQNSAADSRQTEPPPPPYQPYPSRNEESCYQAANHDAADLCAQWSAADAAKETAGLTYWGNWISGFGAILSFASIILVLFALKQGRQANEIADDTAKRQLRAYVVTKNHSIDGLEPCGKPRFGMEIHNFGETPAYAVRCLTLPVAVEGGDPRKAKFRFRDQPRTMLSRTLLGPGDFHTHFNPPKGPFREGDYELIMAGGITLVFGGVVEYRDCFGRRRLSTFRCFFDPKTKGINGLYDLSADEKGNEAN